MIKYQSGGINHVLTIFKCGGSVFPSALMVSIPCAFLSALMKYFINEGGYIEFLEDSDSVVTETQVWSGFSVLVGFLIVFRTSQAYNRFWDGCTATHQMRAEWFDCCSALFAFCKHSKSDYETIMRFKETLVRLFSMLHACALAELEEINSGEAPENVTAYTFELIDALGIDDDSLRTVTKSHSKVELIFTWIQLLIVENIDTGVLSIPAPILSRAFQEIANGMVAFHDALKLTWIPFPFPYAQACDCCLLIHWIITPVITAQWVRWPAWAFVFVLVQVFILWALNFTAVEIENPFGTDQNDLDGEHMQKEMNRHLLLLLEEGSVRTPQLVNRSMCDSVDMGVGSDVPFPKENYSFVEVWQLLKEGSTGNIVESGRRGGKFIRALKLEEEKVPMLSRLSGARQSIDSLASRASAVPEVGTGSHIMSHISTNSRGSARGGGSRIMARSVVTKSDSQLESVAEVISGTTNSILSIETGTSEQSALGAASYDMAIHSGQVQSMALTPTSLTTPRDRLGKFNTGVGRHQGTLSPAGSEQANRLLPLDQGRQIDLLSDKRSRSAESSVHKVSSIGEEDGYEDI